MSSVYDLGAEMEYDIVRNWIMETYLRYPEMSLLYLQKERVHVSTVAQNEITLALESPL